MVNFILNGDKGYLRINFDADDGMALDNVDMIENLISKADERFTYKFNEIKNFLNEEGSV